MSFRKSDKYVGCRNVLLEHELEVPFLTGNFCHIMCASDVWLQVSRILVCGAVNFWHIQLHKHHTSVFLFTARTSLFDKNFFSQRAHFLRFATFMCTFLWCNFRLYTLLQRRLQTRHTVLVFSW